MRPPGLVVLIVLALLAPSVSAGTQEGPQMTDPRDQDQPWKDILALWLEEHPEGVRFTVKVASLPVARPGLLFEVGWGWRDNVAIGFDGTRALRSSVSPLGSWTGGGMGPGDLDDALLDESFKPGSPAYLSGVIPAAHFGFEKGDVLTRLRVLSTFWDAEAEDWIIGADRAGTLASSYRIGSTSDNSFLPILVPAWVLPTIVIGCAAAGMGAGLAIARRKPEPKPVKVATAAPVRASVPPPGPQFQDTPPTNER